MANRCDRRRWQLGRRRCVGTLAGAAVLLAPAGAFAASHVYANGTLGAGGVWRDPVASAPVMNFTRMSITDVLNARACFKHPLGTEVCWIGFQFAQNPSVYGQATQAKCYNDYQTHLSGYCAWYN